jgi:hypothetical protein
MLQVVMKHKREFTAGNRMELVSLISKNLFYLSLVPLRIIKPTAQFDDFFKTTPKSLE